MAMAARVFAHLMDWGIPDSPVVEGSLRIRVEYTILHAPRTNGKFIFVSEPLLNRDKVARDTTDALVTYLNGRFPGRNYKDRDIVLW